MRQAWVAMMAAAMAAATAGCSAYADDAGPQTGAPIPIEAEEIRYETSPCFGACPVYSVSIRPDGSGTFEGRRFTAVEGTRTFQAGPDAYRRFAAALAPHKPVGERLIQPGQPGCENPATDLPGAEVWWHELSGATHHLVFYGGCRQGNEALMQALRAAPELLPIAGFIGDRSAFAGRR